MGVDACTAQFIIRRDAIGNLIIRAIPNDEVLITDVLVEGEPSNDEVGGS